MKQLTLISILFAATLGPASADTLYLRNGTHLNGEVSRNADGTYTLIVEGRRSLYRANEVLQHEQNTLNGSEYKTQSKKRAAEHEQAETERTGLSGDVRAAVQQILRGMNSSDPSELRERIAELVALGRREPIAEYLETVLPSLSPASYPPALEAYCALQPGSAARQALLVAAQHPSVVVRAKAVRLMGDTHDPQLVPVVARGSIDPAQDVRLAAALALGQLGAPEATPVLIALLENNPSTVQRAATLALTAIWSGTINLPEGSKASEWQAFWSKQGAADWHPIRPENLEPLVEPGTEFIAG